MGSLWSVETLWGGYGDVEALRGCYGCVMGRGDTEVLWGRCGAMGMLWGRGDIGKWRRGVVMGPLGCCGVVMGILRGYYGVALELLWGRWDAMGSLWGHYGVFMGRCGVIMGLLWGRCGALWGHYAVAVGRYGALWGCARRTLPEALSPSDRHRVYPALFGSHRPLAAAAGLFLYRRYTAPQRPTAPHGAPRHP